MAKEYHFIVKYSEQEGWSLDTDTEEALFDNGTIYDTETDRWEYGYLGEGEFNGQEDELASLLHLKLNLMNKPIKKGSK